MSTLEYDGSFEGFLTAIFDCYAQKKTDVRIRNACASTTTLFGTNIRVQTDTEKSNRVWEGLKKRTSKEAARQFYCNFLSELPDFEDHLLEYARYVFASREDVSRDFSHPAVLRTAQVARMVGREKHRMEAFVRFQLSGEIYHASIHPDYNVLPLIGPHFKSRYADQRWFIWDEARHYGLLYDLEHLQVVHETPEETQAGTARTSDYARLWKTYFQSTNITERRNMKLHVQHVPYRYWKYLCEKQPL